MNRARIVIALAILASTSGFVLKGARWHSMTARWADQGLMKEARSGACSVLLPDGRVLISGGFDTRGPLASAEIFDGSGSFEETAPMYSARSGQVCAALPDGRVLVAGGKSSGNSVINSSEVYDPANNSWSLAGPMMDPRFGGTASQLPDGRILVAGGDTGTSTSATLEVFDPALGSFSAVPGALSSPRRNHSAAALRDGRVLIAGGNNGSIALDSVDVYDPAEGRITRTLKMSSPRDGLSATRLLNGAVLFAGGSDGSADLASAEVFDPKTSEFSPAPPMQTPRRDHLAFLLPNNNTVLIVGGTSAGAPLSTSEQFIPWQNTFQRSDSLSSRRTALTGTPLKTRGVMMLAGGKTPLALANATASSIGFATVTTDKSDYQPGDYVTITGAGFGANEVVAITIVEDPDLDGDSPIHFNVTADASGEFTDSHFEIDTADLNVSFTLTATGQSSGYTAGTTFTDSTSLKGVTVIGTQTPSPVSPGSSTTYGTSAATSVQVDFAGNGNCPTALSVSSGLPSGATATFSPPSVTGTNSQSQFSLLTISTVGSTPTGAYTLSVNAVGSGDCSGTTKTTTATLVIKTATTLTIQSDTPDPSTVGQAVTVSVKLMPAGNPPPETGTITISDSVNSCTIAVASLNPSGVGSCAVALNTGGVRTLTASYPGDANYAPSSATTSHTVTSTTTTTTSLVSSVNPSTYGQSVAFTATVAPGSGTTPPTGTVQFVVDGSNFGPPVSVSSCAPSPSACATSGATTTLTAATHTVGATYTPSGSFTGSSASLSQVVSKRAITVTADAGQTKVYGAADPAAYTYSITSGGPLVSGDSFSGALTRAAGENVGSYAINQGTLALSANYTLTYVGVNFAIAAKAITVTADASQTKVYGASNPAAYTYSITSGGPLVSGDSFSGALTRAAGENAGSYAITQGTLTAGSNYTLAYVGANFTITPKAITVTADAGQTKIYGAADPAAYTYTITSGGPLVGADAFSGTLTRAAGENVGSYAINRGTLALSANYTLTYVGANFAITPKAITVTADAGQTKIYGAADPAAYTYTITSGGPLVSGDSFSGVLARVAGENVGSYAINQGTLALSSNYTLTYVGASFTITQKSVIPSITANDKTYDGANTATLASCTVAVKVGSDDVACTSASVTFATSNANANPQTVTANSITLTGAAAGNYSLNPTTATTTAKINAKSVTPSITASDKTYDGTNAATLTNCSVAVKVAGDDVACASASVTFASSNASASPQTVTANSITLIGTAAGNYLLSATTATTTAKINVKAASVTPAPSGKTYGNSDPALSGSLSGFIGADSVVATYARTLGEAVGTYTINAALTPVAALGNYSITYNTAPFVISQRPASVTPNAASKIFGDADPAFAGTLTGFVSGDNVTAAYTRTAGETVPGPYIISASLSPTAVLGNYAITYNTANFTINKYTIAGCPSTGCGVDSSNNPNPGAYVALTANSVQFKESITAQVTMRPYSVGGKPLLSSTPLPAAFTIYLVPQDGVGNPLWAGAILFGTGPATSNTGGYAASITGQLPSSVVPGKYNAVVYGDGAAALGSPGVLDDAGYTGTDTSTFIYPTLTSATLTVNKADQTIAFGTLAGKNYGDPAFTVSATGGASGNPVTFSSTTAGTCSVSGNTVTILHAVSCTVEAAQAGNSNYNDATPVDRSFTISPVPLTIKAEDKTKAYGAALPALTVAYTGFVNNDTAASLSTPPTVSTTATAASHVAGGPYAITASGAVDTDYTISYTAGSLTITPVALTITASNQTKVYGAGLPALTVTYAGLVNGDTGATFSSAPNTAATVTTTATAASHVSGNPYAITASGAVNPDYIPITYVNGSLTVTPAALTITADSKTKDYGAALPALTASYSGFVNGDTAASLTTSPSLSTTATPASHVAGNPYAITATGAGDTDYNISYVAGTLTVNPVALTITADSKSKAYGAALPALTASYSGFVNGDGSASLTTQATLITTATAASHVAGSPYAITASGAVDSDYTISYVAGILTVTPVALTITADNQTKAYGAALPTLTASYGGFVNGDAAASLTTAPTLVTTATASSHVAGSPYSITASGAVDSDYTIGYVAGSLTVTAVPLTITPNNQTKVYGAALPTLTVAYTGLVNGDTGATFSSAPNTAATLTTTATAASHVASYPITASGAADSDYSPITYGAGSLTVTPAGLTITADSKTKAYGAALPALTASYTGFVNSDSATNLTTQPSLSTTATAASHVANYPITAAGALDADYSISYVTGTLTVTPVALTITADNKTKPYAAALPGLTASFSGFVNGDTSASLTTQPTLSTTATAASHVGGSPYAITASGAADPDYTIGYVAATLTITPVPLTITADNQTKAYGAALPALTASYSGFLNGDTSASLTTPPALSTIATAASHVAGNPYAITASGAVDSDYTISYSAGSLIVTAVPLTITADNQTKVYGAALPTLTVSYLGLVAGDSATTTPPNVTTTATASSHVSGSPYPITASAAVDADYYPIHYAPGALTVTPAMLTITADSKPKAYGAPLPPLTASYSGLVNGDTSISLATQPTLNTTATAASHVGTYPITAGGAADTDYSINYVAGTLTVNPVALTITPDNKSKLYGAPVPALSVSYSGFVNGDTPSSLTSQPTLSTSATAASHVSGSPYAITASGAADPDYTIGYVAGTLTITPVPLTITADSKTKPYAAALPALTASYSGFVNGDTSASLTTGPSLNTTATTGSHVSGNPYTITATGAVDADYTIGYVAGALTITPVPLTITANNQTKVYGAPIPSLTVAYTGLLNGDVATTTPPIVTTTATPSSSVSGNLYSVTASGAVDSDYYPISYVAGSLMVTAAPTSTTIASSSNPSTFPLAITFTATVTNTNNILVPPAGSVTFMDGSTTLAAGVPLSGGVASYTTSGAAATALRAINSPHTITATYAPSADFAASPQASLSQIVTNNAPGVSITGPTTGLVAAVGTPITFTGSFADSAGDTHTAKWTFSYVDASGNTISLPSITGTVTETAGGGGTVSANYTFANDGVYNVKLDVTDYTGSTGTATKYSATGMPQFVVNYDPSAGFVTGGGWINSPAGAMVASPTLTGKASFGFNAQYHKGQSTPDGQTQFQFQTGNLDFHSTSYQWLVVSGPMAQYKGTGTINGSGNYMFILTARDGSLAGGNTADGFRLKIMDSTGTTVIYDNMLGASDANSSGNTQNLDGGSVVIHSK